MILDRHNDQAQCWTCALFLPDAERAETGFCRAAPPQVIERVVPGPVKGSAKSVIGGYFPPVGARSWCGCHRRDPLRTPLTDEAAAPKKSTLILPPAANGAA
jgi:hypothetical protein